MTTLAPADMVVGAKMVVCFSGDQWKIKFSGSKRKCHRVSISKVIEPEKKSLKKRYELSNGQVVFASFLTLYGCIEDK
jgi:hypothetical protein